MQCGGSTIKEEWERGRGGEGERGNRKNLPFFLFLLPSSFAFLITRKNWFKASP